MSEKINIISRGEGGGIIYLRLPTNDIHSPCSFFHVLQVLRQPSLECNTVRPSGGDGVRSRSFL